MELTRGSLWCVLPPKQAKSEAKTAIAVYCNDKVMFLYMHEYKLVASSLDAKVTPSVGGYGGYGPGCTPERFNPGAASDDSALAIGNSRQTAAWGAEA